MSKKKPNPTIEQLRDDWIDARFSFAALFGIVLEQYGRINLQITFSGDADHDAWFPADKDPSENDTATVRPVPMDHKDLRPQEPKSPSAHVAQILTLLHPKVKAVFGSSALYPILSTTAAAYGRDGTSVEEKINGMSFPQAAQAWMIARRVFAINHFKDLQRMLELLMGGDKAAEAIMAAGQPLTFEEMSDKDRGDVADFCAAVFAKTDGTSEDSSKVQTMPFPDEDLKEITELQGSDSISLVSSKVFRNLLTIAKNNGVVRINVGPDKHPIEVRAEIVSRNGEKTVELTRLDQDVMEVVGQIVQENGKGIRITPYQIYQKLAFADPNYRPSAKTIDAIVASMDKLLFTPATIDFTQQIEKNTKLRAKKSNAESKGASITDTLISGRHLELYSVSYKGRAIEHAFEIRDMPMFYYYSQTFNHIVTIPGFYLSGPHSDAEPKKTKQQTPVQQRITLTELGLQRYLLEKIEYFKKLREKQADKNWRQHKYQKNYQYQMSFDTIAADIGYEITEKKLRMLREQTFEFLQKQVLMENIKGCMYYYKGRKAAGITVFL